MRLIEIKQVDNEHLDESHAMTRMMLRAMGEKDPEAAIKKSKALDKKKKEKSKRFPLSLKQAFESEFRWGEPEREDSAAYDHAYGNIGPDEDSLSDERQAELARNDASQRFENALENSVTRIEGYGDDFNKVVAHFAKEYNVDEFSLADAVEKELETREER